MNEALRRVIFERARHACEYCGVLADFDPLPFCVDHVIAQQHHGATVESNLACCCFSCNSCKGPNIAGIDPTTQQVTRLFNPRNDRWHDHFRWNGPLLTAKTAIGRVTLYVLDINDPVRVEHRRWLIEEGS
jgi:5-methylcytosine-specific restriction endonuclease McrA